jgi:hypothetical protein
MLDLTFNTDLPFSSNVAKITKQLLEHELANIGRHHTYKVIWDSELKGFGVRLSPESRINPQGKASYILQKWESGRGSKKIRCTFGVYPTLTVQQARDKAIQLIAQIRSGQYVSSRERGKKLRYWRTEQAKILTFEQVFELYYKHNHKKGRYWDREIPYIFNASILPLLGKLPIASITKSDCRSLIRAKEQSTSKSTAKALLGRLRPLFKYAVSEDIITINPTDGILAPKQPKGRERVLDEVEIKAYWCAAHKMGPLFGPFLKLLLLTGQRRN